MYLVLIKYFYYFYFLKKNKKFKFFILLDLIFFIMKKYYKLVILKKKLVKYKNFLFKNKSTSFAYYKYLLQKLESLIQRKFDLYNSFIIDFLPTQLLPTGNRKKFYNLINKKYKRFFILIKRKLNKKFFFVFMVEMFNKLKFLFVKSDSFLNKKDYIFNFFTTVIFESKYHSLLQLYSNIEKKKKNKFSYFFNLISYFIKRIDFFIFKFFPYYSLEEIRKFIFNKGIFVNTKKINSVNYFLNKYDLVKVNLVNINKYIFFLQRYFFNLKNNLSNSLINLKKYYYILLSKYKHNTKNLYIHVPSKNKSLEINNYMTTIGQIFDYFLIKKNNNNSVFYNFDSFTSYASKNKLQSDFPFFMKKKNNSVFITSTKNNINNIVFTLTYSANKNILFNYSILVNFINLFFYFYKNKMSYYYSKGCNIVVSPLIFQNLLNENKKLFFYFTLFFNFNIINLI